MSFNTIIGQEKALSILRAYLESGRLQGAFLLTGPEGVGKKLIAVNLAKALNCLGAQPADACDACVSCLKIEARAHPDVHRIENGRDDITIDDVRAIQRLSSLRPYEARKSVFILDNAHRLNPESSNALLKIIEEPPKSCLFFLVTDKPQLLFDTVVSRCKRIRCCGLPGAELSDYLVRERSVSPPEAHYAAYFSEGSIGRALELCGPGMLAAKNRVIDGFMNASPGAEPGIDSNEREEIAQWCMILAGWIRDICVLKAGNEESGVINLDRIGDLKRLAGTVSLAQLSRLLKVVTESVIYLEQNINTKLLLANMAVQIGALP